MLPIVCHVDVYVGWVSLSLGRVEAGPDTLQVIPESVTKIKDSQFVLSTFTSMRF